MAKRIVALLKQLPTTPGVYQFLDAKKTIIYVGKAANLKNRVRSYFSVHLQEMYAYSSWRWRSAKQQMVAEVRDIYIIETASEIEALLLEANLIKKFQPYYNVTLRDDKSYLYVKISTEEEWPRVLTTRTIDRSGTYFGPFTSANAVREVLRVLRKFLPYRCNQRIIESKKQRIKESNLKPPLAPPLSSGGGSAFGGQGGEGGGSRRSSACFWYHLGRCPGTCVGAISKTEYRKIIRRITLFFEGRMDELRRAMKKELGPERAPLEARRPKVPVALPLAGRLLTGRVALMSNVLAHTRVLSVGEQYASDTRDLARVLGVSSLHRIEGYDISNIMGREATGAMVVFLDGEPAKSEYRKFKIKTVHGGNDVAMLKEVLTRRMRHSMVNSKSEIRNPKQIQNSKFKILNSDWWPVPDLMIIDGGKAQLHAALRVLRNFQMKKNTDLQNVTIVTKRKLEFLIQPQQIPVIAIAKGGHGGVLRQKEEIYFPNQKKPLKLPNASPALHLILRVRDEAHRFAIGYHRTLRRKKLLG